MRITTVLSQYRFNLRYHWPWLIALTMLCVAVDLLIFEIPTQKLQHLDLLNAAKRSHQQLITLDSTNTPVATNQVTAHLAFFNRLTVVTNDLHSLSQENGLILTDATYKTVKAGNLADVGEVEITARLKGAYQPLKKMLGLLLASHDGLALNSISIRRLHANDPICDVELQLAFYFKVLP